MAVHPTEPDVIVVSASPSAYQAHRPDRAESALFRRAGSAPWEQVTEGLPPAQGTMTYALAATGDAFYAAPHQGDLYRSTDAGRTWQPLGVRWPAGASPYVRSILAVE